ncbi:quinol monooxygenase YgiN [Georgenia soli]|uniref:Quinol monooxygenase YgiN n=1 Tax=Georgenia soli TaxID=638953 RepID=A0A2A9EHP8_9MICO|nr:antibiotic biosynthesis monooxygenase [Georgenia soli]PFG38051.1 quinol monooxygenase YgiN [Georgenia soli]
MTRVRLRGQLICHDDRDAALVAEHLPLHTELSRAEDGCISFEVSPTEDPLVWQVDELFADSAAFKAHQDRVTDSEWGRATAAVERRYVTEGV